MLIELLKQVTLDFEKKSNMKALFSFIDSLNYVENKDWQDLVIYIVVKNLDKTQITETNYEGVKLKVKAISLDYFYSSLEISISFYFSRVSNLALQIKNEENKDLMLKIKLNFANFIYTLYEKAENIFLEIKKEKTFNQKVLNLGNLFFKLFFITNYIIQTEDPEKAIKTYIKYSFAYPNYTNVLSLLNFEYVVKDSLSSKKNKIDICFSKQTAYSNLLNIIIDYLVNTYCFFSSKKVTKEKKEKTDSNFVS